MLPLTFSPPPPVSDAYDPLPCKKVQLQGSGRLGPCGTQKCHTCITWGRVGYPSPESQFCPAHGDAQSKPVGWSFLTLHPGIPLLGTGDATTFLERIPDIFLTLHPGNQLMGTGDATEFLERMPNISGPNRYRGGRLPPHVPLIPRRADSDRLLNKQLSY